MKQKTVLSIITPTLNAEKYLPFFFDSLLKQTYPRNKIEFVVADGGSSDNTIKIAKKYGAKVVKNSYVQAQPGVFVGMQHAASDLLMVLSGDNIFKDNNAIEKIVKVFSDKQIYAAFPKHDSSTDDSLYSKYFNTFTDPFNHFVYGDASNARTFHKAYKTIKHTKLYDIYDFSSNPVRPILGLTQGFTVRSSFLKDWKDIYDDFAPIYDLIRAKRKIAYLFDVKLYHHTVQDIEHFFRKQRWAAKNAIEKKGYGISIRKNLLTVSQRIKMYLFPFYAYSIIIPIGRAFYNFILSREKMWLFHPIITCVSATAIAYEFIRLKVGFSNDVSRLQK